MTSVDIKTPLGLGDAVYCYPIVEYYSRRHHVNVSTCYPQVFSCLDVRTLPPAFPSKHSLRPRYQDKRHSPQSQYQDMLDSLELPFIPFRFEAISLPEDLQQQLPVGKRICLVKEPCAAHMHKRTGDFSLAPSVSEMQSWIDSNDYFYISVGYQETFKSRLNGIDLDLNDKLSVSGLLALCSHANAIITQVGHLVPIAQGLNVPLKIFYPETITDPRLRHLGPHKMKISGVHNEI